MQPEETKLAIDSTIATGAITLGASLNVLSVVLTSSSFDAGTINIMYE